MDPTEETPGDEKGTIRQLTRHQRRVLGVLLEKGFTTPDQYPLTLKATTTGCNQKSNRSPLTDYSEDDVLDALEELRALGLVAELHTDGGRAPRYRHYVRKKYDFSEPQLAILTELLLRGRQQLGELRTRASRMVHITDQSELRQNLETLQAGGWIQSTGPLSKRGIEVDHTFYESRDGNTRMEFEDDLSADAEAPTPASGRVESMAAVPATSAPRPTAAVHAGGTNVEMEQLTIQIGALKETVSSLQSMVESLKIALVEWSEILEFDDGCAVAACGSGEKL